NGNTASTSTDNTVTFDPTPPTVTINQAAGQADPTSTAPITFTAVFSEPASGFTASTVVIGGTAAGTTTAAVTGGPSTYTVAVSGLTAAGTVLATHPSPTRRSSDLNGNTASTSTDNTVTFDPTPPTVTINQAAGQADPTSTAPITFTAVFSESVSGFTGSHVIIRRTAGHMTTVYVAVGSSNYTVAVSGLTTGGTFIASYPARRATHSFPTRRSSDFSTDNTVTFDPTPPTVTINQAAGQADPTSTAPITFTAVFSESVSGFTGSDVVIGGTAGGTKTVDVTGGPSTYTVAGSGRKSVEEG